MTPNPNPLVDEATLLDVLSHLRQYPQQRRHAAASLADAR
jgi:hypothetical protein